MKTILYNTQTNTLGISYTGNYTDNYTKGKLKEHEHNLIVVNLPVPDSRPIWGTCPTELNIK